MVITLRLVLMLLAFMAFVAAAFGVPTRGVNLMAVGLAMWILAAIVVG